MIRETIKRIVVEVLFNPTALDEYLQDEQNNMNKLLNIGKALYHIILIPNMYHMIFVISHNLDVLGVPYFSCRLRIEIQPRGHFEQTRYP